GKRPGADRLALAAQDLAGNTAGSTREFTVRLRYIDLFKHKFTPRGRILRVRVSTDVKTVAWRLGPTRGNGKPPLRRLPVPSRRGPPPLPPDRERKWPPIAGNRPGPQVASLTCPGSCRLPHRSNARSPTPRNWPSPQAWGWRLPTGCHGPASAADDGA